MGSNRRRTKHCTVVVDDAGKECGRIAVAFGSVWLTGVKVHVNVCNLHNGLLKETAASMRLAGKR